MKKLLPIICIVVLLYSCKKDKIPYNELQGKWREARYQDIILAADGKTTKTADTSTYEILNFSSSYAGEGNTAFGPFAYSLKTLKLHYSGVDNRSWDIALPSADTLTLTEVTHDQIASGTTTHTNIRYFGKLK